jgi:hypothetical protein
MSIHCVSLESYCGIESVGTALRSFHPATWQEVPQVPRNGGMVRFSILRFSHSAVDIDQAPHRQWLTCITL